VTLSRTNRGFDSRSYATTAANTVTSSSFTPAAGALLVVLYHEFTDDHTPTLVVTNTHAGTGAWSYIDITDNDTTNWYVARAAYAVIGGSPGAGTVTYTRRAGTNSVGMYADLIEVTSTLGTPTVKQSITGISTGASLTVTLPATPATSSYVFSALTADSTTAVADPTGYTNRFTFAIVGSVSMPDSEKLSSAAAAVAWTGLGSYHAAGLALEVADPTGAGSYTGTVAKTLDATTSAATGTYTPPSSTGTVAQTLDATTGAASGTFSPSGTVTGTVAKTLASVTSAGSGTVTSSFTGSVTRTLAATTSGGVGTFTATPVSGSRPHRAWFDVRHPATPGFTILPTVGAGSPGNLVSSTSAGPQFGADAYSITYAMTGVAGTIVNATGAVWVPTGAAPASGRPVIACCHGAVGLGDVYAPGLSGWQNIGDLITAGYVVVSVDGEGLGSSGRHPYSHAGSGSKSVCDAIRACAGLTTVRNQAGVFGFSIGGLVALQTAEYAGTYAPELNVVGVGFDPVVFGEYAADRWSYDDYVNGQIYGHWAADSGLPLTSFYSSGLAASITSGGHDQDGFPTGFGELPSQDPTTAVSGWSAAFLASSPGYRKGNSSLVIDFGTFNGPIPWLTRALAKGTDAERRARSGTHDIGSAVGYHSEALTWVGSKLASIQAATVLYVANYGNDGNPGTAQGAPKATITSAIAAMPTSGGTITILDSGAYAPMTITKQFTGWCRIVAAVGASPSITTTVTGGATPTTNAPVVLNNATYVAFYGIETIGVGSGSTDGEDNGFTGTNGAHHIAVWKCKIHHHSGHGIAASRYPNNTGVGCNHITLAYNRIYDCQLYNPYAGSAISLFQLDNVGGAADVAGVSNYILGNWIYDSKEVVGPHSDGNAVIMDWCVPVGYTGTTVMAFNVVGNVGGGGLHTFKTNNVKKYFNTVLFTGRDLTTGKDDLFRVSSCFDDIGTANDGTIITGYRTRYNVAANGVSTAGTAGAPNWWNKSDASGGEDATNNVVLQIGSGAFYPIGANNTDKTAVGTHNYFVSEKFMTTAAIVEADIAGFVPTAAQVVRYDMNADLAVFNMLAQWPDYQGTLRPADKNWAAGGLEIASTVVQPASGTVSKILAPVTVAASGSYTGPSSTGTVARTLVSVTSAATGTFIAAGAINATATATLGPVTLTASGTVTNPPGAVTGSLGVTLQSVTVAASGVFTAVPVAAGLYLFRTPNHAGWRAYFRPWWYWPGAPLGIAVLKLNGVYVERASPSVKELAAATEVYFGGHENYVDGNTAVALIAAGYTLTRVS
jgi:hypothetical protein